MEMVQLDLSWCESVQRLLRYGFHKIRTDAHTDTQMDGRTDAGYFIVPPSGFFETGGGQ